MSGNSISAFNGNDPVKNNFEVTFSSEAVHPAWDKFLEKTEGGHHTQTSAWARVKAPLGWSSSRVIVSNGGQILGGAQILFRRTFLGIMAGYIPKGPLLAENDAALGRFLIRQIMEIGREKKCFFIAVQPPSNGYFLSGILEEFGFQKSGLQLAPTASLVIDLSQGEECILKRMKQKTRQHINQGIRTGFEINEGGRDQLDVFYNLYQSTARRQGFLPFHVDYFYTLWDILAQFGWIKLILIYKNGEPITGQLLIPFGDTVIAKMIGWSGKYSENRPNEIAYWSSMKWAMAQGFRYFDFEGLHPEGVQMVLEGKPCNHKNDIFKYGFGGEPILFPPAYDYLPNPVFSWLYHRVNLDMESETLSTKMLEFLRKR